MEVPHHAGPPSTDQLSLAPTRQWDRHSKAGNDPQAPKSCTACSSPWVSPGWHPPLTTGSRRPKPTSGCSSRKIKHWGHAGSACPSWWPGGHAPAYPPRGGPGETLWITAPPQGEGIREGNLPLPFERVLQKSILDSDHENCLMPPPPQASRPLPGGTRSVQQHIPTSRCRQLSRAAQQKHQNLTQAAQERVKTRLGRNQE